MYLKGFAVSHSILQGKLLPGRELLWKHLPAAETKLRHSKRRESYHMGAYPLQSALGSLAVLFWTSFNKLFRKLTQPGKGAVGRTVLLIF